MIKIEDNVSVVLLSAMLVTFLIFGFIHVFTPLATTFWIGLGNEQAPDENLLIMMRNFGWMFLIYAIGLVMVLTSPKDPHFLPSISNPMTSAASSIKYIFFLLQIFLSVFKS